MRIFLFLLLFSFGLAREPIYNGTIHILEYDKASAPSLSLNGKALPYLAHPTNPQKLIALIPISYYQTKPLTINTPKQPISIPITQKAYKQERISVAKNKVQYDQKTALQIKQERQEAKEIYATFSPSRYWNKPFILPVDSVITSHYGNARIFNNQLQSYHTGTDFRAAIGTPIRASNDGKVVLAKERYLAGKSIIIDHGEGIYSVYFHLSDFKIKEGDLITQGQIIGLSGNSGRTSGPHLHFGIVASGVVIDALDFIQKIQLLFHS